MSRLKLKKFLKFITPYFLALFILMGCGGEDKPFTLVEPTAPDSGSGSGSVPPGSVDGCVVNFIGKMQLQVSASGIGDIVGTRFIDVDPIPLIFNGTSVTLRGSDFPDVIPFLGDTPPADMVINGDLPDNEGVGTYDPATGRLEINEFKFLVRIFPPGDAGGTQLGQIDSLPGVTLTTDSGVSATGNGPTSPLTVDGKPYDPSDGTIALAIALTLPDALGTLPQIDDKIGGGALTAVLDGTFDQDPSNCTEGGGGGPVGGGGPEELSVSVDNKNRVTDIDFKSTLVLVRPQNGENILDCSESSNRGPVTKMVTITNTGEGSRKIHLLHAVDTDDDKKNPLCSGKSEFVRGSIKTHGAATCQSMMVGDKEFLSDECVIPPGSDNNKISFPLIYLPFNFVPALEGESVLPDTGSLIIEYDDDKTFALGLKGTTEPDSRDSLSVSKVKDGNVSKKRIANGGLLKIALSNSDPQPFTQKFVLSNDSLDSFSNVTLALDSGTNFTANLSDGNSLGPQVDSNTPGSTEFEIVFSPSGGDQIFQDRLTVTMTKAGSAGDTTLTFDVEGTVGIDPILGNFQLKIDYISAMIDNGLLRNVPPVESLDFRNFPTQAPKAQIMVFSDVDENEVQPVTLLPDYFDVLTAGLSERTTALRLLNAQGSGLVPGDDSTLCNEADPIDKPYPDFGPGEKWDCAYFYFNLQSLDGAQGIYDEETGNLTMPDIQLRIQNPYHGAVGGGVWPKSDPTQAYPNDNRLDTNLILSLTTHVLDRKEIDGVTLVPDSRITLADLNLTSKEDWFGKPCTSEPDTIISRDYPKFRCFLTSDKKNIHGKPLSLRTGETDVYDVILVGIARFNTNTTPNDFDIPVFMNGSNIYLVLQARLCPEGVDCNFSD